MNRGTTIALVVGAILLFLTLGRSPAGARLIVLVLGAGAAAWLLVRWRGARPREAAPRRREIEIPPNPWAERVAAMSLDEARRRAEPLLAARFQRVESAGTNGLEGWAAQLAPSLAGLFETAMEIRERDGGIRLTRAQIRPFELPGNRTLGFGEDAGLKPYLQIGTDASGNPVLARPGEDAIYVLRRTQQTAARYWLADYPSVFHWLLIQHPELRQG